LTAEAWVWAVPMPSSVADVEPWKVEGGAYAFIGTRLPTRMHGGLLAVGAASPIPRVDQASCFSARRIPVPFQA
jgi:hypothetical protein